MQGVGFDRGPYKLSHAQAQKRFDDAGIGVHSSGNCSDKTKPNCTSFDGVNNSTVNGIIRFKDQSGCDVTITGGTEVGHSPEHTNGEKLDISYTSDVTNYIQNNFTHIETRGDGAPQYRDADGNTYADEFGIHPGQPHWDIHFR